MLLYSLRDARVKWLGAGRLMLIVRCIVCRRRSRVGSLLMFCTTLGWWWMPIGIKEVITAVPLLLCSWVIQIFGRMTSLNHRSMSKLSFLGEKSAIRGFLSRAYRGYGLFAKDSCRLLLHITTTVCLLTCSSYYPSRSGVILLRLGGRSHAVDGRLRTRSSLQLLHRWVVVLQVAVLKEDQIVVPVRLYAILAESVCALVAGPFDLFSLMSGLLAVGDALSGRGSRRLGGVNGHRWKGLFWGRLAWRLWGRVMTLLLLLLLLLRCSWYRLLCWLVAASGLLRGLA